MPAVLIGIACTYEGRKEYAQLLEVEQPQEQKKSATKVERPHQPGNFHCSAKNVEKVIKDDYDDRNMYQGHGRRGRKNRYKDHARKPGRSIRMTV